MNLCTIEGKEIIIHSVFDNRQDPEKLPQQTIQCIGTSKSREIQKTKAKSS